MGTKGYMAPEMAKLLNQVSEVHACVRAKRPSVQQSRRGVVLLTKPLEDRSAQGHGFSRQTKAEVLGGGQLSEAIFGRSGVATSSMIQGTTHSVKGFIHVHN